MIRHGEFVNEHKFRAGRCISRVIYIKILFKLKHFML